MTANRPGATGPVNPPRLRWKNARKQQGKNRKKRPKGERQMIIEKKITLFTNNKEFNFEYGKKMTWNGTEEMPVGIETFEDEVMIAFKSGRKLNFHGIPSLFESFTDHADVPF
jgi:hypothetical protein